MFRFCLLLLLFSGTQATIAAGVTEDSLQANRILTIRPGAEYASGWFRNLFLGKHWRSLWITPLKVQVLDLKAYGGGLTPLKTGGGYQTKSLHFKGADGKYYKFRSINKDPKKVLPKYLQKSFVADVLQDQISTSHPLSAFIVAPLLNAVGVLNAEPMLTILPDDPGLGEYREEYKGLLGTLAENPKDDTEDELIFAGADKIIKEYKIFERLEEDNDNQIDSYEYLKARLMDIFLGDWDRHVGQWKWARFKEGGKKIWKPIPRDRDQAFSLYDGLFPWLTALAVPQIEGFDDDYPQTNDLTWSGRHLDRRFLVGIDKPAWDSITTYVQTNLTDEIIENAVHKMPPEWFDKEGDRLIRMLKNRKKDLPKFSYDYYKMISTYVSIFTSNKPEFAEITRLDDQRVEVAIYKKNKQSGEKKGKPFFYRIFQRKYTKDIRIDLLGGDDTATIEGKVASSILVRIIGGDGDDILIDNSKVSGYFLAVTPFPDAEEKTLFYDSDANTNIIQGASTKVDRNKVIPPKPYDPEQDDYNENFAPQTEDRGYDWKRGQWLNFSSDDGYLIGGGAILYHFGFRVKPYVYRMSLLGSYATTPKAVRFKYSGEFYTLFNNTRTLLEVGRTELAFTKFYGFGNESIRENELEDEDYYRVGQEMTFLATTFEIPLSDVSKFWLGFQIKNSDIDFEKETILDLAQYKTAVGYDRFRYLGLHSGFQIDTRDHPTIPFGGVYINFNGSIYPQLLDNNNTFGKASLDLRTYLRFETLTTSVLALRIASEKLWGSYPFFESTFLGGNSSLRGFSRERFAGNSSLFTNVELRSYLFPLKIVVPGRFGFSVFVESGRVYYPGEDSKKWHPSYGGGVWTTFIDRIFNIGISVAQSSEKTALFLTSGFMF